MQLLQDVFIIENLQILSEGKNTDTLKLRGVFGRCNEKNNNGRVYPTAVLEGQLQKIQPLIDERRLCGELDHPQNDTVKLSNASHLITKLELKGDELIGEAELLKTPAGLTAKALVEGGVKIGISSRGMGTLSEDAQGNKIVNEDFRLVTFDLVADPSTRGAYPTLAESTESRFVKDSTTKLQKESNFLTLLESKLKEAYTPFIEESSKKKRKKLTRKQKKLDINKNNRLDSEDFSMLRAKVRESVANYMYGLEEEEYYGQSTAGTDSNSSVRDLIRKETSKLARRNSDDQKDTGSILGNMRARAHAKKLQIAKAKGARKASKIMAKGDVEADRIRARGAAGGSVSMFGAGTQKYAQETRGLEQRKERIERSKQRLADRLSGQGSSSEPETPKVETPKVETPKVETPKRSGRKKRKGAGTNPETDTKTQINSIRGALGGLGSNPPPTQGGSPKQETPPNPKKDPVNPELRKRAASLRGTGNAPVQNPNTVGPKGKLPGSRSREDNHTVYKQIGLYLAEAFGLVEGADAPMKGSPRGVNLGEPRNSGESRKASYNDQYARKQNKARKDRERAKTRH